ncbi:LysR family transcriptional regulator [Pediococcus siamensis]|uniref:LysR family transcriptional regulator n=1 Tax=Pediococcus siamensis TaxID=381829 RepID=UPI0039A37EC4
MDVRVLRYFLAIAQEHNISRAAQTLHISQPALSRQISDLETELGVKLFERGPREIKLTTDGHYLRERANEIVGLVDKTAFNLQSNHFIISGRLDIGAGESVGMQRIMDVIGNILKDYPDVRIQLHSGDSEDVEAQLDAGVLDFGVIMGEQALAQYGALKLPEVDHWGVVLPADAVLAQKSTITAEELLGHPLIVSEQALQHSRFLDWWHNLEDQMTIIGTYNLIFNGALLVRNGSCYALTFEHLLNTHENPGITFRRFSPALTDPITVIWKKNQTLSNVAQLFLQRLRANVSGSK